MFPIPLPPWLARRLPAWWRLRRLARMMRRLDRSEAQAARNGARLVSDYRKKGR